MKKGLENQILEKMSEVVALGLWELEAIKINLKEPFRLVSGNFSPIYVNCRSVISDPSFMALFSAAARTICERKRIKPDVIAGGETAGIPFAAYVAQALSLPMVYVRKAAKGHGIANLVEGGSVKGKKVLLVEDLITDAGSKLHFIEGIKEVGGSINHVLVLFNRLQGGGEALESKGIRLYSMSDINVVLEVGVRCKALSRESSAVVAQYLKDPKAWHLMLGLIYK